MTHDPGVGTIRPYGARVFVWLFVRVIFLNMSVQVRRNHVKNHAAL
jgi:hypothetical protein